MLKAGVWGKNMKLENKIVHILQCFVVGILD